MNFFLFLSIFFLFSCKEKTDLEIRKSNNILVVEGEIDNVSEYTYVKISKTASLISNQKIDPYYVDYVIISDNEGNIDTLDKVSKSNPVAYISNKIRGKIGNTYYLKIVDGVNIYTAQSTMPAVPDIDSIYSSTIIPDGKLYPFIRLKDPENQINYYRYYVKYFNRMNYLSYAEEDVLFNGTNWELFPLKEYYQVGDEVEFFLLGIDKPNYEFFKILFQNLAKPASLVNTDDAYDKVNPPSNIVGENVLGYFSAHSVKSVKFTIN